MSEEDDVWKGVLSSIVSEDYSNSNDIFSSEVAAWVDSCLVKDPELSDCSWNALTDALLDIISCETPSDYIASVVVDDVFQTGSSIDVLMSEERGMVHSPVRSKYDHVPAKSLQDIGETDDTFAPVIEKDETELFRGFLLKDESIIRDRRNGKKAEVGSNVSFTNEVELPLDDIFKVWDLNISVDEEDELVKELEKALAENPHRTEPLVLDDSVSNDFDMGTLDDLIAGIADLSLHSFSGS